MDLAAGPVAASDRGNSSTPAEEFVPLSAASVLAYARIGNSQCLVRERLGEGLHLGAIALATLVPVYMRTGAAGAPLVLHPSEALDLLFSALSSGVQPDLASLMVRRTDLGRALQGFRLLEPEAGDGDQSVLRGNVGRTP